MMSDNNSDCFSSLFGDDDKLGLLEREQLKRNRQRVDAGEPRNSYSSIPNFSSRSSLMSSGLYGAIFSQQSQNFGGLFPANYAPAKMLNELLGRQVKQAQDASNPNNNDGMLNQMESASNNNNSVKMEFDGSGGGVAQTGANSDGAQSPPTSANDLAHHMLRNILQGKKDLMALDQELRQAGGQDRHSPDSNQNTILNKNSNMLNNNNLINNNNNYQDLTKSENVNGSSDNDPMSDSTNNNSMKMSSDKDNSVGKQMPNGEHSDLNGSSDSSKKNETSEIIDEDILMSSLADGSDSMPSPGSVNNAKLKEEMIDGDLDKEMCRSPSPSPSASNKSDHGAVMDLKRARVENIVSTIHSSPALGSQTSIQQPQVNGCKKRKLYHPQQHDNSAVERYAAGLSMGLNLHNLMLNDEDEEEEMEPHIHQKRTEKNVLKSQLRSMQEQLAEMQQKYVQLCNRMEQHSETTEDVDDATSDLVDDDLMRENLSEKRSPSMGSVQQQRTPSASPIKDMPGKASQVSHAQTMLNQMMSKMMTAKLHHPSMPFNGTHPLLQHMQQQQQNAEHVQHPAFNNAAAMYLSQKLLMEQEARMAKEADDRNQQHQLQMQQQQQQQQMQKQQEKVQQEMMAREQQAQSMHQMHQQNAGNHQTPNIPPIKTSPQQQNQLQTPTGKTSNVPSDMNDRLSMMRANAMHSANNIGPVTGSDLEGLADILKSEINSSLSSLVDSIVSRFVHQRRMMGKQTEAAAHAAAELNKDLMMASQILDRKSPRTKSSGTDRVPSSNGNPGNVGNANCQSGNGSNNSTTNSSNNNTNNNHHMAPSNAMTPIQHHLAHQSMLNQQMTSNGNNNSNVNANNNPSSNGQQQAMSRGPPPFPPLGQHMAPGSAPQPMVSNGLSDPNSLNSLTQMQSQMNPMNLPSHVRPSPTAGMFQGPPKQPGQAQINSVAAAALYNSISAMNGGPSNGNPFCMPEPPREATNEQNEALSLVVTPKKKRHKVTDTRITPRTVSRILAQDALAAAQQNHLDNQRQEQHNHQNQNQIQQQQQSNGQNGNGSNMQNGSMVNKSFGSNGPMPSSIPNDQSSPRGNYHHSSAPSMLPVSLPTSVAIPNPSLHESQVFSPYSPFFNPHGPHGPQSTSLHHMHMSSSPPGIGALMDPRDSPPLPHPPTMLHPALLAAAHHGASPDYGHIRAAMDANDRNSDCNSADISYDGMQPTISFSNAFLKQLK